MADGILSLATQTSQDLLTSGIQPSVFGGCVIERRDDEALVRDAIVLGDALGDGLRLLRGGGVGDGVEQVLCGVGRFLRRGHGSLGHPDGGNEYIYGTY